MKNEIARQFEEDTCTAHKVWCCPKCFDMRPMAACAHSNTKFEGWLAAPGHGQSWKCLDCGEALWSPSGADGVTPFKDLDPSEFIMSAEDVI